MRFRRSAFPFGDQFVDEKPDAIDDRTAAQFIVFQRSAVGIDHILVASESLHARATLGQSRLMIS